jgi:hypothetical protein
VSSRGEPPRRPRQIYASVRSRRAPRLRLAAVGVSVLVALAAVAVAARAVVG